MGTLDNKISKKDKLKVMGINLLLGVSLYGVVTLNKRVFRPAFNHYSFAQILTGSFPNFIAAYLISLCVVNPVLIKKPKFGRPIVYIFSLLVMTMLIIEEFKSIWGASKRFDIYDIVASAIGSLLAILTYEYLNYRQINKLKRIELK